jgi:8-oxo-dGTP pyrophosphatase MutT (NUDIX family)
VVTSFLRYKGKILLFQRSASVGTYRGKWGACSGYIEGNEDPKDRALIEIREETGLQEDNVTLVKEGNPLEIFDEQKAITWVVHPFLFDLKVNNIQIDWEHVQYKWVSPEEIQKFDTVPKLRETYERVRNP